MLAFPSTFEAARFTALMGLTALTGGGLIGGCTFVSSESDGFPSVHMQQVKTGLRPYKLTTATTEAELEDELGDRSYPKLPKTPSSLSGVARVERRSVGDFDVLDVVPRKHRSKLRVLYLHGGSYSYELTGGHLSMLGELVDRTGATLTVPIYPLTPEFSHADAAPFVQQVYTELLEDGPADNLIVAGDSAGGGFALAQVQHYRTLGLDLPTKLVLISPWLDVTMSNPEIEAMEGTECMLVPSALRVHGQWWADKADPSLPEFSPLFGDFTGLPPVLMIGGTDELLLPDMRDLARLLGAEQVQINDESSRAVRNTRNVYFEYPGGFHDFPLFPLLPESKDALERIAAFLEE